MNIPAPAIVAAVLLIGWPLTQIVFLLCFRRNVFEVAVLAWSSARATVQPGFFERTGLATSFASFVGVITIEHFFVGSSVFGAVFVVVALVLPAAITLASSTGALSRAVSELTHLIDHYFGKRGPH